MLGPIDWAFKEFFFFEIFDLRLGEVKINNLKYSMDVTRYDWFDLTGLIYWQNLVLTPNLVLGKQKFTQMRPFLAYF